MNVPEIQGNPKDQGEIAYLGWQNEEESLYGIRDGYKDAADDLVDIALQKGNGGNNLKVLDTYIYPICFLYRHSIEISLKLIYWRCYHKLPDTVHDLMTLFESVKNKVIRLLKDDDFINQIKSYKKDFHKYDIDSIQIEDLSKSIESINKDDPKSDRYRYLMNTKNILYNTQSSFIDYSKLKDFYTDIYEKLDFVYFVTDEYLSS